MEGFCLQGSIPFSVTGLMMLLSFGEVNPDSSFWGFGTGTPMTPNYVSNSSVEVSLWCTCESSGNQKEKCDQILGMFESNKCLGKHQSYHRIRETAQHKEIQILLISRSYGALLLRIVLSSSAVSP